jgi:hypothetical protein
MWQLIAAIATGVIGLGAYWYKSLRELKLKYDAELRHDRLERYLGLWTALEPLAKYGHEGDTTLSRDDSRALIKTLQTWYFHTAGLYLSVDARNAYDALLAALNAVAAKHWGTESNGGQLDQATFDALRVRGSHLRSNMTRDVGTRNRFILRWDGAPIHVSKVEGSYKAKQSDGVLDLAFPRKRPRRLTRPARGVGTPTLTLGSTRLNAIWDPWLWTLTAEINGPDCVFTLEEDGKMVQAPCDSDLDSQCPPEAKIWRREQPATALPQGK